MLPVESLPVFGRSKSRCFLSFEGDIVRQQLLTYDIPHKFTAVGKCNCFFQARRQGCQRFSGSGINVYRSRSTAGGRFSFCSIPDKPAARIRAKAR